LYIESICNDPQVLEQNYRYKMMYSPDYKDVNTEEVRQVFTNWLPSTPSCSAAQVVEHMLIMSSLLARLLTCLLSWKATYGAGHLQVMQSPHYAAKPDLEPYRLWQGCPPTEPHVLDIALAILICGNIVLLHQHKLAVACLEQHIMWSQSSNDFHLILWWNLLEYQKRFCVCWCDLMQALKDFQDRIAKYEEVYETITDRSLHYIKLIDM